MRISYIFPILVSLASLAVHAAPFGYESVTLDRRNGRTVKVGTKTAVLGKLVSPPGHKKSEVYRLEKWDNTPDPGYVIKIYTNGAQLNEKEKTGLTKAGQFIAADETTHAVVMKEVHGTTLAAMFAKLPPGSSRKDFVASWKPKVAAVAAKLASEKGILHIDLNMNNVVVDGSEIEFVDWEHYVEKGALDFTTDKKKIESNLDMVWDSSKSDPTLKNSKSPKSPKSPGSPTKP
ncbi:hypothetical protein H0H87_004869 [Tephrocybe sp. NHM501043]|nr:hypothetical protein H0H87_004869 [Tephrocybe sp. NHM501043]